MSRNPLFEAGVGVAYEANESFDRALELSRVASQLAIFANTKLDRAKWAEDVLGVPFDPNQDIDIEQLIGLAEAKAEADRWVSLRDSAGALFTYADRIEKLEQNAA